MKPVRKTLLLVIAMLVALPASADDARGWLGFSVKVESEGLFSNKIKQVVIGTVAEGSPEQRAGLVSGQRVVALEGVEAAKLSQDHLKAMGRKKAGEQVVLDLQSEGEGVKRVVLTAAPRL